MLKINLIRLSLLSLLIMPKVFAQTPGVIYGEIFNCDPITYKDVNSNATFALTLMGELSVDKKNDTLIEPTKALKFAIASVSVKEEGSGYPDNILYSGQFNWTPGKMYFSAQNATVRINLVTPDKEHGGPATIKFEANSGSLSHPKWTEVFNTETECHFSHQEGGGSVGGSNRK